MKYALLFNESQADFDLRVDPVKSKAHGEAWRSYGIALKQSGVVVTGAGLQPPPTATTIRVRDGKRQVQDGPYAETKEMLGGFWIIDVPDIDTALEWAARSPAAGYGSVEVRPVLVTSFEDPV